MFIVIPTGTHTSRGVSLPILSLFCSVIYTPVTATTIAAVGVVVEVAAHVGQCWRPIGDGCRAEDEVLAALVVVGVAVRRAWRQRAVGGVTCCAHVVIGRLRAVILLLGDAGHRERGTGLGILAVHEEGVAGVQRSEGIHVALHLLCKGSQ